MSTLRTALLNTAIFHEREARSARDKAGCLGCDFFRDNDPGMCTKHKAIPPEEVVAAGCDDWQYDGIPF